MDRSFARNAAGSRVVFVMLMACANAAGLLMGRAAHRQREMALRTALGSPRRALVAQLLTENFVLALAATAMGILFAYVGVRPFAAANPFNQLPPDPLTIHGRALTVALGLAVLSTLLSGIAPALKISRVDLASSLRTRAAGARAGFARNALAIAQIALSLILLTGTTVLTKAVLRLASQPLGFHAEHLQTIELTLPGNRYAADRERRNAFYSEVLQRLGRLPGVGSVAITTTGPLLGAQRAILAVAGRPEPPKDEIPRFEQHVVTRGYCDTLSTPILRGRVFGNSDTEHAPPVAIINEAVARVEFSQYRSRRQANSHWQRGDLANHRGRTGNIRTIFFNTVVAKEPLDIYVPASQANTARFTPSSQTVWLLARRSHTQPGGGAPAGRFRGSRHTSGLRPNHGASDRGSDQAAARAHFSFRRGFDLLALTLSAIGIYGLIAQNTTQRTSEIGIRMVLGAQPGDVLAKVLRQGVLVAAGGIAAGVAGALLLARAMSAFLYGRAE